MEQKLIKNFDHLREYPFGYFALMNIRMMRLTDEDWDKLIEKMNDTYSDGLTREDLNEVFSSANIDYVREWIGKSWRSDEIYPKYYLLTSHIKGKKMYIEICDSQVDEETLMDEDFIGCQPEFLGTKKPNVDENIEDITWVDLTKFRFDEECMWDIYKIPIYAIYEICRQVLDPDGKLDYYDTPDTFALNQLNANVELNEKDKKNIDEFVSMLKEKMPEGFDIDWDKESCESPEFEQFPEFGLGMDCVLLRVYPKNPDRLKS